MKIYDIHDKKLNSEGSQDFISLKDKIDVPHTTIQNREKILNPANDLGARMGVNRIMTQKITPIADEFGPNGEKVYKLLNDKFNTVRCVGNWISYVTTSGVYISTSADEEYIEITFFGTGLNYLTPGSGAGHDVRASIDGGAYGADLKSDNASLLNLRNYSPNVIVPVVKGLSLDVHTVKIKRQSGAFTISGYEVLNESANVQINKGVGYVKGMKAVLSNEYIESYLEGVTGIRGGRVVKILKASGEIESLFQPVDAVSKFLVDTEHSNEEIIRKYNFREFGAGRADDFSTLVSPLARAFTLDDGTTTLVTDSGYAVLNATLGLYGIAPQTVGNWLTFTFIGTGLDVVNIYSAAPYGTDVYIDGVNVGTLGSQPFNGGVAKLCSGLPYGTHTFKMHVVSGIPLVISDFIVYGPKEPSYEGMKIVDYNVLADYVANTVHGLSTIAKGVIRKHITREFELVQGASASSFAFGLQSDPTQWIGGFRAVCNYGGSKWINHFFGTGFEMRSSSAPNVTPNVTVYINGILLTSANFPTAIFSTYGTGTSFNSTTGVLDIQDGAYDAGLGFTCSGLPLGSHNVEFRNEAVGSTSNYFFMDCVDIITPIHSYKDNGGAGFQNTRPVGNQSIGDSRNVSSYREEGSNYFISKNLTQVSVSSSAYVPIPYMNGVIKTKGGVLDINLGGAFYHASYPNLNVKIFIDGKEVFHRYVPNWGAYQNESFHHLEEVSEGVHYVECQWVCASGTLYAESLELTVKEDK